MNRNEEFTDRYYAKEALFSRFKFFPKLFLPFTVYILWKDSSPFKLLSENGDSTRSRGHTFPEAFLRRGDVRLFCVLLACL